MENNMNISENKPERKKVIFSGIQPTSGAFTLGNYLGAVKNWGLLQDEYNCAYCIVNQHAITVRQDPKELKSNTLSAYALMLACGIDPKKSIAFIQSHVNTHAQLAWILDCYTQFGEASRMTQFKDKSQKHADNVNVGLFAYPVLMAADILLYQANYVPIGEDQKQHLEITRNIAERFNGIYGNTFTIPEPFIGKVGARIMSLQNPNQKMSKSDPNPKASVSILDEPSVIMKKFKSAVTDSEAVVRYGEGKDGINNLMAIYSCCTGASFDEIEREFEGKGYGDFKTKVGEAVIEELTPVRENFNRIVNDKAYLSECMAKGAETAQRISERTLNKVMKKVGFLLK